MIQIKLSEIQDDFLKRFNQNKENIRTFRSCNSITVLGNGMKNSKLTEFQLPISLCTYVTINLNDTGCFSFQTQKSNKEYSCTLTELKTKFKSGFEKKVFNILSKFEQKINGAKILFNCDTDDEIVFMGDVALFRALEIMSENSISDIDAHFNPCTLYGRKNFIISKPNTPDFYYIPFNLSGYKLIIISLKSKLIDFSEEIGKAYFNIKKNYKDFGYTTNIDNIIPENLFQKYLLNEIKRQKDAINILNKSNGDFLATSHIIEKSMLEYFSLDNKKTKNLRSLYEIAKSTHLCSAIIPAFNLGGICAVLEDKSVDRFLDSFSTQFDKTSQNDVSYYICDSQDSGIELFEE